MSQLNSTWWRCRLPELKHSLANIDSISGRHYKTFYPRGLYYKHIRIVNDDSRVIRMTLQAVASPMIVIMTTLEVSSCMLLGNIHSTGITCDYHLQSSKYFYSPGHCN